MSYRVRDYFDQLNPRVLLVKCQPVSLGNANLIVFDYIDFQIMFLRFRRFEKSATRDLAFYELYNLIHKEPHREDIKSDIRVQVSLVESQRVNGTPRQKHIAVLVNLSPDNQNLSKARKTLKSLKIEDNKIEIFLDQITRYRS